MKPLDLDQTAYDAVQRYPELAKIIAELGFPQAGSGFILQTLGRRFTLNQAIAHAGLDRKKVVDLLTAKGFSVR